MCEFVNLNYVKMSAVVNISSQFAKSILLLLLLLIIIIKVMLTYDQIYLCLQLRFDKAYNSAAHFVCVLPNRNTNIILIYLILDQFS